MGVSQELLYEFRTVQVVLGFPRVFCTAVRVNRRRERQFLLRWINGLHNQTVQMTGSATSHSLSEALPLQEVLHSPIRDSAANYFFNHKLLDNCSLLSLPLFGSLLLSHSATIENKRMNEGQGNHKNREFISFRAKKKNKLNTVESGTFTFISLLLGFFFFQQNMAVATTLLCPSYNDRHTCYSAPPAVSVGWLCSFSPKKATC